VGTLKGQHFKKIEGGVIGRKSVQWESEEEGGILYSGKRMRKEEFCTVGRGWGRRSSVQLKEGILYSGKEEEEQKWGFLNSGKKREEWGIL
jgi:hypothetical protein